MEVGQKKNISGFISCVEKKMFTIKMSQLLRRCIIVLVVITGPLIGCEKKSEIMQHFQGRLCDKLCIFSGLINIVLPGFNGEKSL